MKLNIFARKKFKCNACGNRFKTESELDQHRRKDHK